MDRFAEGAVILGNFKMEKFNGRGIE